MPTISSKWGWLLGIAIISADIFANNCAFCILCCNEAIAQITPDTSLPNNTQVNTIGNTTNITGGTQAGTNLFHSFQDFSVLKGNTAFFNNTVDIENIISRVTGGSISNIDGLIRANGTANLFLLNPNGIVFGQNARLDIGGSFIGSTANRIKFADGTEFKANSDKTTPLLTISVPLGLQFGTNPGAIAVKGIGHEYDYQLDADKPSLPLDTKNPGLEVRDGKTLALVGGNVSLDGAILKAPAGRIEIGSFGSNSSVNLNQVSTGWKVSSDRTSTTFADIQVANKSWLGTTGVGGGEIALTGKDIRFASESIVRADTTGNRNGGGISIVGDSIDISKSNLGSYTFDLGNSGSILLDAKSITIENNGGVFTATQSPELGAGKAGDITFNADSMMIQNQGGVKSNSFGAGDGGQINVNANSLHLNEISGFGANAFAKGNSGDMTIKVGEFIASSGGIGTNVSGAGNAGKVNITAGSFQLTNGAIFSNTNRDSTGNAGKVNITADSFQLTNGAIFSNTNQDSTGNSGEIILNISHLMTARNAYISVQSGGTGNGGKISINANQLQIEGSGVVTNTTNRDQAGEIDINVTGDFTLKTTGITNTSDGTGNGGKITIKANSFNIQEGGGINTATTSTGKAGDINIDVKGLFSLEAGTINTNSFGNGNGGIINISAGTFNMARAPGIISQTQSVGKGGDININVKDLFDIQDSAVKASSSVTGNGGIINISAGNFNIARTGIISETQSAGTGGDININVKDLFDIQNGGGINAIASGTGGSGSINISTGKFKIEEGVISSETKNTGNAGDIKIDVKHSFTLTKSNIFATSSGTGGSSRIDIIAGGKFEIANSGVITETQGTGKGGDIKIDVKELVLKEPGINPDSFATRVMASSRNNGNAGNIELFANQIVLDGIVAISSNVGSTAAPIVTIDDQQKNPTITVKPRGNSNTTTIFPDAVGDSGNITINAKSVSVINGAQLTTSNFGTGNAGNIRITTGDAKFDGKNSTNTSGVSSSIAEGAVGNGGTIEITTNNLALTNGAQLTTSNLNQGNAGNIIIKATDKFLIDGVIGQQSSTGVFAESQTGKGGNITLTADFLALRRGGLISSISNVKGAGGIDGNIDINTKLLVAVPRENSDIIAIGTGRSPGSNIQVRSQGIFGTQIRNEQTPESDIVATGQVTLYLLDADPNKGLVTFPVDIVDASRLINKNFCAVRRNNSRFTITGRGGLPLSPDEPLRGHAVITPWVTLTQVNDKTREIKEEITKQPTPQAIVEAQGWVINDKGEVTLVAAVPTVTPHDLGKIPSGCQSN